MLGLQCAIVGGFSSTVVALRSGATAGSPAVTVLSYPQDSQPLLQQHSPRTYPGERSCQDSDSGCGMTTCQREMPLAGLHSCIGHTPLSETRAVFLTEPSQC